MASTSRDERMENSGSSNSSSQQLPPAASSALATLSGNLGNKQKYIENYDFPYCDESSKYEKVAKIGQGTFGEVFKAREKKSQKKFVAMKKVLMDNEKEGVSFLDIFSCQKRFVCMCFVSYFSSQSLRCVKFAFCNC